MDIPTTDLMLFALLLALVAMFLSNAAGGLASEGGIYVLLALAVGFIAAGISVVTSIRE